MDKKLLFLGIGAVVIIGLVAYLLVINNRQITAPSEKTFISERPSEESVSSSVQKGTAEVLIEDFSFKPAELKIKTGTTVNWTNNDDVAHDVDSDTEDGLLQSELLERGESYSFKFDKAGTYNYHCHPHPFMKATVVVSE